MTTYSDDAWDAIQSMFDDPTRQALAERLDLMLDILETADSDRRVRRHRMQKPKLWHFSVSGNGETWSVLWEPGASNEPYVHFAGPGLVG